MADPAGATVGLRGCGLKSSGVFPSDMLDFRQDQLEFPDKVVPRWFGHGLSLPPDSGVGLGSTERAGEKGAARRKQSTLRPTIPHPAQRKRRAGSRMTTDFDLEADLASEGTQRGTPRKRALFGVGCCGSESPIDDATEVQAGLSADNDIPEWTHSSGVGLADMVARLQREVEDLRSDSMFNHTGGTPSSSQRSRRTMFTSTKVPRFAGTTS